MPTGPPTVFLHIGTPKTGTSYLQSRLTVNRAALARQGVLWPLPWKRQLRAVGELRQYEPGSELGPRSAWRRIAEQVRAWHGVSAIVSMERMVWLAPHQIDKVIHDLEPCRIEVLITARDLLRTCAAQWQELTRYGFPWSWHEYTRSLMEGVDSPSSRHFWGQHDVPGILQRWVPFLPAERIHLVTVPPAGSGPELLWDRFTSVVRLDGSDFDEAAADNPSLGVVSAELMHRINLAVASQGLEEGVYHRVFHQRLATSTLPARRQQEDSIAVSPEMDAWLRGRANELVNAVSTLPIDVVGELEELRPTAPLEGREPTSVSDAELLAASIDGLVGLARSLAGDLQRAQEAARRHESELAALRRERDAPNRRTDTLRRRATESGPRRPEPAGARPLRRWTSRIATRVGAMLASRRS